MGQDAVRISEVIHTFYVEGLPVGQTDSRGSFRIEVRRSDGAETVYQARMWTLDSIHIQPELPMLGESFLNPNAAEEITDEELQNEKRKAPAYAKYVGKVLVEYYPGLISDTEFKDIGSLAAGVAKLLAEDYGLTPEGRRRLISNMVAAFEEEHHA